jgi:hypothetical protein
VTEAAPGPVPPAPPAGLCRSCRHRRLVANTRGSTFSLCRRARWDAALVRYPRLPVLDCHGHEPAGSSAAVAATSGRDG